MYKCKDEWSLYIRKNGGDYERATSNNAVVNQLTYKCLFAQGGSFQSSITDQGDPICKLSRPTVATIIISKVTRAIWIRASVVVHTVLCKISRRTRSAMQHHMIHAVYYACVPCDANEFSVRTRA